MNRARPPGYDWVKQLSVILIKGMRSFVNLATDLRSAKYDMTIDGSERYPCPSERYTMSFKKYLGNGWKRHCKDLMSYQWRSFQNSELTADTLMEREFR